MKNLLKQFGKHAATGTIAFLIDYALLAFCTEVVHIDYMISATIGFIVSVIFSYFASMRYVFTHKDGMSRRREFIVYVVLSAIGLALNNTLLWVSVEIMGIHYLIGKIGATACVTIYNFFSRLLLLDAQAAEKRAARKAKRTNQDVR